MATELEKIDVLEAEVKKLKETVVYYRKLFMEDGQIDSSEQKELDAMDQTIKGIEKIIADKRATLSYYERGVNTVSNLKDDVVEFVTDGIHAVKDFVTGENHEDHIEKPTIGQKINAAVGKGKEKNAADTRVVQTLLNNHGARINVDGDCGAKTIAAIEAFQQKAGIPVTGVVEPNGATLLFLNKSTVKKVETPSGDIDTTKPAQTTFGPEPSWISKGLGQLEKSEEGNPDKILEFIKSVSYFKDRTTHKWTQEDVDKKWCKANQIGTVIAWCGCFATWCMGKGPAGGEGSAASWASFGTVTTRPFYGCIASRPGHVGFATGLKNGKIKLLSGNMSDKVKNEIDFAATAYTFLIPPGYTVPEEAYFQV